MAVQGADFPHDIFRFLIKPIRDGDSDGILELYLGGPQRTFEETFARIDSLHDLHNVDDIADEHLQYLQWIVGWTVEVSHITDALTASERRKLIRLSAEMWRLKGTELGIKLTYRALTGRDAVIYTWFHFRWELGVAGVWRNGANADPWLVGDDVGDHDEYVMFIFVMNELGINKQLMHDLAALHRPVGEVFYLVYADLVDDFSIGRGKWALVSGTDIAWDSEANNITLPVNTEVRANVAQEWGDLDWFQTAILSTASQVVRLTLRSLNAGDDQYRIEFNQTGLVTLSTVVGGVVAIVASATWPDVLPIGEAMGLGYRISRPSAGELRIQARIGVDTALDHTFSAGSILPPGGDYGVMNLGPGTLIVDNVLAYQSPVYVDYISPASALAGEVAAPTPAPTIIVEANMTSVGTWTLTGLWHSTGFRYHSPHASLYFGQNETGHHSYGTPGDYAGAIFSGSALTPTVDLTAYPASTYRIWVQFRNDPRISLAPGEDDLTLEVLVNSIVVKTFTKAQLVTATTPLRLEMSEAAGQALVQCRFTMNTVVNHGSTDEGWYVDDLYILATDA